MHFPSGVVEDSPVPASVEGAAAVLVLTAIRALALARANGLGLKAAVTKSAGHRVAGLERYVCHLFIPFLDSIFNFNIIGNVHAGAKAIGMQNPFRLGRTAPLPEAGLDIQTLLVVIDLDEISCRS